VHPERQQYLDKSYDKNHIKENKKNNQHDVISEFCQFENAVYQVEQQQHNADSRDDVTDIPWRED
jgi:hypothetical protein